MDTNQVEAFVTKIDIPDFWESGKSSLKLLTIHILNLVIGDLWRTVEYIREPSYEEIEDQKRKFMLEVLL